MTSLNTVSTLFGGTAPHGLKELYGVSFNDGTSAPASGPINLRAFNGKSPKPRFAPPTGTTLVIATISPSPLTYTSYDTAYTVNIAGPIGPQSTSTHKDDVRGVDIHPNNEVTMRVYDSRYSGYSQLKFWGNYESVFRSSITRSQNDTFNTRFGPSTNYTISTAENTFGATAVVSCFIPMPRTVTQIDFYYTKTEPWAGWSITFP